MSAIMFNKAVHINNNNGVALFESGRFEEAKDTFESSLAMMRSTMTEAGNEEKAFPNQHVVSKEKSNEIIWSEIPVQAASVGAKRNRQRDSCSVTSAGYCFQRAIIMQPTATRRTAAEYGEESSAVIYNLAVTHHCMAIEKNSDIMLKQALQFYKIAHKVITHKRCKRSRSRCGILMVIMNNLGQLHHVHMLEFDVAQRCFQRLLVGLQIEDRCCGTKQRRPTVQNGFNDDDIRGFMLNVMLERPTLSAAA